MELLLIAALVGSLAWVGLGQRDVSKVMVFLFGAISLAGVTLTLWQRVFGLVPPIAAQVIIVVFFIGLAACFKRLAKQAIPKIEFASLLPIASLIVAGILVGAKIVSLSENPLLFSGAGRLAYAEDNAKWLNFSAILAQNEPLNFSDGTGGGLAVLIIVCSAAMTIISQIFLGGNNVAGTAIAAVLATHSLLIIIAPLALAPVVTRYFARVPDAAESGKKQKTLGILLGTGVAALLMVSAVGAASTFGHLSAEMVMVQLLFWLTATVFLWDSREDLLLVTLIGASTALVWLPLPPVAAAIIVAAFVVALVRLRQSRTKSDMFVALGILVLGGLTVWLTVPEVQYLAASTQPSTSTHLVFAEGATMAPKRFELVLLGIAVAGSILYAWTMRSRINPKHIWRVYPFVLLFGFALAVLAYDFVIARDGWPHYGARKLSYIIVIICTAALLPIAFQGYYKIARGRKYLLTLALVASVVGLMLSQTMTQVSYYTFKRNAWVNFDQRFEEGVAQKSYWAEVVNPPNRAQGSLASYPVACVQIKDGVIQPGINDAYFCTRFLMSLHGAESFTNALFYPILVAPSPANIEAIRALPAEIRNLDVLVLNEKGVVVGTLSVAEYIRIYAKQAKRLYQGL